MAKNRFQPHSNQPTPAMSPSHTYTAGVSANPLPVDEEDLDDICPVCDGECTCANRPKPRPTLPSNGSGSALPVTTMSNPSPRLQSLKIKLTVPPGMLSKARAAQAQANSKKQKNTEEPSSGIVNDGERSPMSSFSAQGQSLMSQGSASGASGSGLPLPKRRGRPPKTARASTKFSGSDRTHASVNEANTLQSGFLSQRSRSPKRKDTQSRAKPKSKAKAANLKGKGTTARKGKAVVTSTSATKKKRAIILSEDDSESDLTDLDGIDDEDDGESVRYPTFMSASAMSTSTFSEDSETASSSGFDTDSSMEAEEENYILTEERRHEKARVRRELLGDDGNKRKDPHNDWVIRPRKQSVGPDDVDMEVDSDATEDDDDDEEEGDDEEDADEMDESGPGAAYAGVATGWSDEDEESSFDADLFFANLSDTTGDGESTSDDEEGEPGHISDVDTDMAGPAQAAARRQMDNLPFEVSQGWDGQIVFTNGLGEGPGILDLDFEVSAAQLVEDSASPSQDSDVEMQTTEGEDDGEYEDMDGDFGGEEENSDGGDTTDDDYVDEKGLPTRRMLDLFRWPSSVSAIDPMSTVSPAVSPSPRNRRRHRNSDASSSREPHSPRPADILAGKIFWEESDDRSASDSSVPSPTRTGAPVMGRFEAGQSHPRRAILTGSNKDIPSPFPRIKNKKKTSSYSDSFEQFRGRPFARPHSLSISSTSSAITSATSEEQADQNSSHHSLAEPIELHDVLDVSFLDPEPVDSLALSHTSASEDENRRHIQNIDRWGHVPMGTFRRTRESGAIISDGASASWQAETPRVAPADGFTSGSSGRMLKSSPFSEITWHGRGSMPPKGTRRRSRPSKNIVISPVLLPVHDGDRTPTNFPPHPSPQDDGRDTHRKTRKELRRESKMKRKSLKPVHHQHQHYQRQHFHHSHHPNTKSRSTSSMQRSNFFNSPTSSVPPLNL